MSNLSFSPEEAESVYELINMLSGNNAENVFAWDGSDTLEDVQTKAMAKLFRACGRPLPPELENME